MRAGVGREVLCKIGEHTREGQRGTRVGWGRQQGNGVVRPCVWLGAVLNHNPTPSGFRALFEVLIATGGTEASQLGALPVVELRKRSTPTLIGHEGTARQQYVRASSGDLDEAICTLVQVQVSAAVVTTTQVCANGHPAFANAPSASARITVFVWGEGNR